MTSHVFSRLDLEVLRCGGEVGRWGGKDPESEP